MTNDKSMLSRIITWTIIGVLAILAIKIAVRLLAFLFGLVGMAFGLFAFLFFTVGPILLVGWLAMKAWNAFTKEPAV